MNEMSVRKFSNFPFMVSIEKGFQTGSFGINLIFSCFETTQPMAMET